MKKQDDTRKGSVSVWDNYSSANYDPRIIDEPKKPVLYTHDGKPLRRGLSVIGLGQKVTRT